MKLSLLALLLSLITTLSIGCTHAEVRTYDITVRNATSQPVVLWLTKDGPLYENEWLSPEDIAIQSPKSSDRIAGVTLEPGRTARTGPRVGKFESRTSAVLRIYNIAPDFDEILAISRGSGKRVDYPLEPGQTKLVIRQQNGRIAALMDGN